jgi:hypothetical protein
LFSLICGIKEKVDDMEIEGELLGKGKVLWEVRDVKGV